MYLKYRCNPSKAIILLLQHDSSGDSLCDCLFGEYAEDPDGPKRPYTAETGNNRDEIFVVSKLIQK